MKQNQHQVVDLIHGKCCDNFDVLATHTLRRKAFTPLLPPLPFICRVISDTLSSIAHANTTAVAKGGGPPSSKSSSRLIPFENIKFAGGTGSHTVLSILAGEHSIGGGILQYFNMKEANDIRLVCPEFLEAVTSFPWMDAETHINGSLEKWRKIFPYARAVNVSNRSDLVDADFVHIRGIHTLDMSSCEQETITDAAFVNLHGIHTLDMSRCSQGTITDKAFVNLHGIHTLDMSRCSQGTITDAAFENLRGIHTLNMSHCSQKTITDAAFVHLRGIHTLNMSCCSQETITDAAFVHLRGIHTLNMSSCEQETITDAAFVHLRGIHTLDMSSCEQETITDAAFVNLRGIHPLDMSDCSQETITDAAFENLHGIHTLKMAQCNQATITDAAFVYLQGTIFNGHLINGLTSSSILTLLRGEPPEGRGPINLRRAYPFIYDYRGGGGR